MTGAPQPDGGGDHDRRRPRLLSPWFWLALIFGLACIVAGLALARLGPKYL